MSDCISGCFISGDYQQNEKTPKLLRRKPLAINHCMHHHTRQIICWVGESSFAKCLGIGEHADTGFNQSFKSASEVWVTSTKNRVRPIEYLPFVRFWDAHHFANYLQRKFASYCINKIKFLTFKLLKHTINNCSRLDFYIFFDARNLAWRKALRDNRSQAKMLRVIHADHRPEKLV